MEKEEEYRDIIAQIVINHSPLNEDQANSKKLSLMITLTIDIHYKNYQ